MSARVPPERIAEMRRLREEEMLNDVQIGAIFEISRERVAQLIGRKGRYIERERKQRIWEKNKHVSNEELADLMGVGKHTVAKYRKDEWHEASGQNSEENGFAQKYISNLLSRMGIEN